VALVSLCFLPVAHASTFAASGGLDTAAGAFRTAYAGVATDAVLGLLTG
jgi:hypothetical protein